MSRERNQSPPLTSLTAAIWPPATGDDPLYQQAKKFATEIDPAFDSDYGWVWDHAKDMYDRAAKINKELDDKANDLIKYLGGGTGLFTLGVIANVKPENFWVVLSAIVPFAFALLAVYFAIMVRRPNEIFLPPSARTAFEFVDAYGKLSKATFIGQWNEATCQIISATRIKARRLTVATWLFFFSILLLGLPVATALAKG